MIIFSHCLWEKCASWMVFCTCLTPLISLTSLLQLTWIQFSLYLTCIHRTQCLSYCSWQSVPVLWREHQMWHFLQMSLSSLVTWCSWWLHGMLSTFFSCASCLLLSDQASDFRTSDHHLISTFCLTSTCTLCHNRSIGDKYHYLFECGHFEGDRKNNNKLLLI